MANHVFRYKGDINKNELTMMMEQDIGTTL